MSIEKNTKTIGQSDAGRNYRGNGEAEGGDVCPRWLMTLTVVAVIFGVFAIGLVVLLIYKSTLTMHRDDQLFLDDASSRRANGTVG
jgi:hypothetical protein